MPATKKPAPQSQLQAKFKNAVFKMDLLRAANVINDPQYASLSSDLVAIKRVEDVQKDLYFKPKGPSSPVAIGLDLPINKLKATFVAKMDTISKKLAPQKAKAKLQR